MFVRSVPAGTVPCAAFVGPLDQLPSSSVVYQAVLSVTI
jgi:hypothetical protein